MAQTYWDPGTLLQITDFEDRDIQCVGEAKTRNNARCGWRQPASDSRRIRSNLAQLAAKLPSQVTKEDLEVLARLCLCSDWHYRQWPQVVQRWEPVVAKAERDYERMEKLVADRQSCLRALGQETDDHSDLPELLKARFAADAAAKAELEDALCQLKTGFSAAQNDLLAAQAQARTAKGELEQARLRETKLSEGHRAAIFELENSRKSERARLENVVAALQKEVARHVEGERVRADTLREAKLDLEHRLAEATSMAENSASRVDELCQNIQALAIDKETLETYIATLKTELDTTRRRLGEESSKTGNLQKANEDLERRLSEAQMVAKSSERGVDRLSRENQMLNDKYSSALDQLSTLRSDLASARDEVQRLKHDNSAMHKALQKSRADIDATGAQNAQLVQAKSALQARVAALEADISRQWRHRLRAMISKLRAIL